MNARACRRAASLISVDDRVLAQVDARNRRDWSPSWMNSDRSMSEASSEGRTFEWHRAYTLLATEAYWWVAESAASLESTSSSQGTVTFAGLTTLARAAKMETIARSLVRAFSGCKSATATSEAGRMSVGSSMSLNLDTLRDGTRLTNAA